VDERYLEKRRRVEELFTKRRPLQAPPDVSISPGGRYRLEVSSYGDDPKHWACTRGIVTRLSDGKVLGDIKRNYSHFWHCWVEHPNGKEYLLCGEDYQGYSLLNLTDEAYHVYFPEEGYKGAGFCWVRVYPSPDQLMLAVDGCYWACPYDLVFYDFRTPDKLPYRELGRVEDQSECEGWLGNETFALKRGFDTRASDGKRFEELTDAEQDELLGNPRLRGYETERAGITRPSVA